MLPPLLIEGDIRERLAEMQTNSIDAIITDPPYELDMMSQAWDRSGIAYDVPAWEACLRVLKPGGYLLAFGGPRTYHRVTCAIEDAGFDIRDCLSWMYSSGMPKSHNLKAEWQGWGTALKPAWEPIIMARKPLAHKNVATNMWACGVGAMNIEASRIPTTDTYVINTFDDGAKPFGNGAGHAYTTNAQPGGGRWPANVLLDEGAADELGELSRYFFCSKASVREKNLGLDYPNKHPTVKPITLMEYLIDLVAPLNSTVLDPFMGSGSTGCAAMGRQDIQFVGIDLDPDNVQLSRDRMAYWQEVHCATA